MKGRILINAGNKKTRRELDFYPTPAEVTEALLEKFKWSKMTIWEPACGDGSMSKVLQKHGHSVYSSDLRETGYGIGGENFLETNTLYDGIFDAIITNPPFCYAEEFIKCALSNAKIVAMVLKSQYWHSRGRSYLLEQYPPAWVLALTWRPDFLNKGKGASPTMEVIWTVWIEGVTDTRYGVLKRVKKEPKI
jgi:hypothetical protein